MQEGVPGLRIHSGDAVWRQPIEGVLDLNVVHPNEGPVVLKQSIPFAVRVRVPDFTDAHANQTSQRSKNFTRLGSSKP
jgi:hypothetical protein